MGYAWVLFNPLMQLLVYSFVFSFIFRFHTANIPYSIFLFVGLLPWIYLQVTLTTAATCLVDDGDLLKKVAFPREVLPYAVVASKGVDFVFSILILAIFMFFYHIPFESTSVFILPILLLQLFLMTGLSLIISAANLFYRDIQYLNALFIMIWMYLSPVVYPLSLVPQKYIWIYRLNPMVGIIEGYRAALFNEKFDFQTIISSIVVSLLIFIIGFVFFKKSERIFADIV